MGSGGGCWVLVLSMVVVSWSPAFEVGDTVEVAVESTALMRGATTISTLARGTSVRISEIRSEWLGVHVGGESGWIRQENVVEKRDDKEPAKLPWPEDIYQQALKLLDNRDYSRATELFGRIIAEDPQFVKAYMNRGFCLVMQRRYAEALPDFDKTIGLRPDYAYGFLNRSTCYRMAADYDRAIGDLDEAIRLDPQLAMAYYQRGIAYEAKGETARARADHDKALELDPDIEQR